VGGARLPPMNTTALPAVRGAALLGLTLILLACGSAAAGSGTPAPASPSPTAPPTLAPTLPPTLGHTNPPSGPPAAPGLDGRTFLSVNVTNRGVEQPLVPGTTIRLSFTNGQISASAGCNIFGGTYRLEDGVLIVDGGGMTEMGCDEPRMAQDNWLFGLLGARPTVSLDGNDLQLTSVDTTITMLDREIAEPDQPLVGTTWRLSSIISGGTVSSIPDDVLATIQFNADGSVGINPGCNSAGGRYAINESSITFSDLVSTDMACQGARGEVEAAVMAVLSAESITFTIDAGSLTLTAADQGLQFTAG
jgi:heat shock protein HslJ